MEKQIKLQKRILAVILSVLLAGGNLQAGSFSVQASGVDETLPAVGQARASAHSHAGWTAWSNTSKMPDTAGNYYLTVDVNLTGSAWTVPNGTTNLCLNSYTIKQTNSRVINVPGGATFNLYDENDSGRIMGGSDTLGGGIKVEGKLTMNGGQVTGNTATSPLNNQGGAGIAVAGGEFIMNGGIICDNSLAAFHGGGVIVHSGGTMTMTGGKITRNAVTGGTRSGGGVHVAGGSSFTMSGGEISGNTSDNSGGGVNVDGTFTMSGGTISGNTAKSTAEGEGGGGISIFGKIILTGGTITGNTAKYGGGILYMDGPWSGNGSLTLSGSPVIYGNHTSGGTADNNIYLSGKYIKIGSEGLKEGAHIGVKTKTVPATCADNVKLTESCANYSKYFTSDAAEYEIKYQDVIFLGKTHVYQYASSGSTITQSCKNCSANSVATLSLNGTNYTYTGSEIKPAAVTYSGNWQGTKPELTYSNNINAGTATAVIEFNNVRASATFTISPKSLTDNMITLALGSYQYTGSAIMPAVTVKDGTTVLLKGTDYNIGYENNINTGTDAKVKITGRGNYTGNASKNFEITAIPLTGVSATSYTGTYDGEAHGIKVDAPEKAVVKYRKGSSGSYTLSSSPTYTDAGTYTVYYQVTKANYKTYTGSAQVKISKRSVKDAGITLKSGSLTYNGNQQTQEVEVTVGGRSLTAGTDYTVSGNQQTNAGTYTITITGDGNYSETKTVPFTIEKKPLADEMVTVDAGPYYYTGVGVMPAVTVKDGKTPLTGGTDYDVSYADNKNVGTARVTVRGKGNYSGSINRNYTIEYRTLPENKSLTDYVTISPEPTDDWYNVDIILSPESGCSVGDTPANIGRDVVTISQESIAEGSKKAIYVKDSEGNIYETEFFYKLDKTPPVIDLTGMIVENGTKNLRDWIIGKTSMRIQIPAAGITDTLSGIEEVSYTVEADGGTIQTEIVQAQGGYYEISLNAEFSGTIRLTAKDKAGNATQTSLTANGGKIIAEDYAPVVSFAFPNGLMTSGDGWYNTAVTITVTATDDKDSGNTAILSGGIAGIQWKDGENGEEQTVTGLPGTSPVYRKEFSIQVTEDGTHTYYVKAVDNAGNESEWQTVTVKLDTGSPFFCKEPAVWNPTKEGADIRFTPSEGGKAYWMIADSGTEPNVQEVKEQSGQKGGAEDIIGNEESSFTITGLTPGEKQTVYVVLEDAAGNLSEVGKESFFTIPKAPEITLEQLNPDYRNETVKLPEAIGNVEVYTDPSDPSGSRVTPGADGSLPVVPGTDIYIRYPEGTEDGMTVPASDKTIIRIPDRPVLTDKQVTVTDHSVTLDDPDSEEEYVLVKKGEIPDWGDVNTTGTFTGLDADTEYDLYVRIKATENHFVSKPEKTEVRTKCHTMEKTEAKEPTCTESGNREYWTCSDCHKLFADGQGNTETDSSKIIIPADGHTFPEQWTVEKEATENKSGRQYKSCEICGVKIYRTIEALGTPADPYAGKIEKEVEVLSGAPDTVLNNSREELAKSILTPEEIDAVDGGANAKIWLEIAPDVDITEAEEAQVEKTAEESVGAGVKVTYFDASLFKQVGNGEKERIHEPKKPVSVTIVIPEEIRNKDVLMVRDYQIIRLHEGKIDIIKGTYNEGSAEFTFETDKFSTYAICYKDSPKQTEPGTPTPTPEGTEEPGTPAPDESDQTGNEIEKRKDLSILLAAGKQKGSTGIKLTWLNWKGASGYEVYWSYCDGKKNYKKLKTVKAKAKRSYTHKKLKKNRAYKYYIAAYKVVDGKKKYVAKSPVIHVAMKYEKRTNAKKITVNKTKLVLSLTNKKYKKKFKIRAKVKKENSKKKLLTHAAEFRYYTDDKKAAKVSRDGMITTKGKGTCTVYVIANNGVCKKIKVTVK